MMVPSNYRIRRKAFMVFIVVTLALFFLLYKRLSDEWMSESDEQPAKQDDTWIYPVRKNPIHYIKAGANIESGGGNVNNIIRSKPLDINVNLDAKARHKDEDVKQKFSSFNQKELVVNPKHIAQMKKDAAGDEKAAQALKFQRVLRRQLQRGITREGRITIHVGNRTIQTEDQSAIHRKWHRDIGQSGNYEVHHFGHFPDKFRPETGNGHISAVVFSNRLHVNGMLTGAGKSSRRARFPTIIVENITRVFIGEKEVGPLLRRFSLNMADGVFTQVLAGPGVTIEQRIYAHRNFTPLYIHEIDIYGDVQTSKPMLIRLEFSGRGVPDTATSDATLSEDPDPFAHFESFSHRSGEIHVQEDKNYPKQPKIIHLMSTELPSNGLEVKVDEKNKRVKWVFIMSVSSNEHIAREFFELGLQMILNGDWLYLTHLDTWHDIWNAGRVQVENEGGTSQFPVSVISAQYFIYSSLPWRPHEGYEFSGLSPGGLGHGDGPDDRGFMGHVYWDQDMFVFPSLMMLHPKLARLSMLQYRVNRLPQAIHSAKLFGLKGAKFPWESGFTGNEMTSDVMNERHQHHVTGAVVLAAVNYILSNNDTQFLLREGGDHLIMEGARFWKSRLTAVKVGGSGKNTTYRYEIWDVMGPDEYHERVNNSAYTNALAQACLRAPARIQRFTRGKISEEMLEMEQIAKKIYVPFDRRRRYHPEFDGYKIGTKIKQADTILLGYPLNYIFDSTERRNDLLIYQKVLGNGPGMSWGMHAIGWLELKDEEKAWAAFKQQFMHIRSPFKVWSEYSSGGRVNFLTAAGGFLQSIINGYFGLRIRNDGLYFDSTLPPQTSNVSINGLNYLGNSVDLVITEEALRIRCSGHDPLARRLETEIFQVSPRPVELSVNMWVTLQRGRGVIRAKPNGKRWPNRRWRLRRNLVDADILRVRSLARNSASERQSRIEAWRKHNRELALLKWNEMRKKAAKTAVPIEEVVALRLKQKKRSQNSR